jgi:hypothetical protein
MTKEQAFEQVKSKVAELQDAVCELHRLHRNSNVGLDEWIEHMDNVMWDLADELRAEAE